MERSRNVAFPLLAVGYTSVEDSAQTRRALAITGLRFVAGASLPPSGKARPR